MGHFSRLTCLHDLGTWSSLLAAEHRTAETHTWRFNPLHAPQLHVSSFGRDSSFHILRSSVIARPAETGEVIWNWQSYSVYKHVIASNIWSIANKKRGLRCVSLCCVFERLFKLHSCTLGGLLKLWLFLFFFEWYCGIVLLWPIFFSVCFPAS